MSQSFDPTSSMLSGYLPLDGTIEFYGRVNSILKPTDIVLDWGAGRGAWYFEDECEKRRLLRDIKPKVQRLIGADVDPIVLSNPTTIENYLIENGRIPLPDHSVDVILADYVLEHISDIKQFSQEINRLLKPNGFFCARTPHKFQYVSIAARIVKNKRHSKVLSVAQPNREVGDIFPTVYRLNTIDSIKRAFPSFKNYSYLYSSEPAYYFGNRYLYPLFCWLHKLLPTIFVSNIFIFLKQLEGGPNSVEV